MRSLFEEFETELNRFFSASRRPEVFGAPSFPALNVRTNEREAVVTAELPGIDPAKLELSVEDSTLTLRGARDEEPSEGAAWVRRERWTGAFERRLRLPFRVDGEKAQAHYAKGVLTLTLPRLAADLPKKIAIKTA